MKKYKVTRDFESYKQGQNLYYLESNENGKWIEEFWKTRDVQGAYELCTRRIMRNIETNELLVLASSTNSKTWGGITIKENEIEYYKKCKWSSLDMHILEG